MIGGVTLNVLAAHVALIGFCLLALFQLLLACGVPLGRFAWGGQLDRLPVTLRIGSGLAVLAFLFGALVLAQLLGYLDLLQAPRLSFVTMWVFATLFAFNVLSNAMSKSPAEKRVMTPTSAVLSLACVVVATSLA
jgi:hypothetical protein